MIPRSFVAAEPGPHASAEREAVGDDRDQVIAVVTDLEERHGQAIFGLVRRLGLTDEEAQDCVQEAIARLWIVLDGGQRIDDSKAWVYRTAYRLAMDHHRLRRRVAGLVSRLAAVGTAPPLIEDASDALAVWTEVDRLPERQRQVLYLRYRGDLAFDQIASVLGLTSSAARSHSTQAIQTLRRRLAAVDPEREHI